LSHVIPVKNKEFAAGPGGSGFGRPVSNGYFVELIMLGLLFLSQAKAQDSISRRVVVQVLKTDTVVLTNDPAGQKAVYVDIRIVSEKKGR
jgi:hypothetical protein